MMMNGRDAMLHGTGDDDASPLYFAYVEPNNVIDHAGIIDDDPLLLGLRMVWARSAWFPFF